MSKFVNFKKREIALPPGCKDLIDVLKPGRRVSSKYHVNIAGQHPAVSRAGQTVGGLSEIRKYVAMVLESRAVAFTLQITSPNRQLIVSLFHENAMKVRTLGASLLVQKDADSEKAVRGFLSRHHLRSPEDTGIPEQMFPDEPWQLIYEISAFPSDAAQLARILIDLYREVGGLTDESELNFHYADSNK